MSFDWSLAGKSFFYGGIWYELLLVFRLLPIDQALIQAESKASAFYIVRVDGCKQDDAYDAGYFIQGGALRNVHFRMSHGYENMICRFKAFSRQSLLET